MMSPIVKKITFFGVAGAVLAALLFAAGYALAANTASPVQYSGSNPTLYQTTQISGAGEGASLSQTTASGQGSTGADIGLLQAFQNASRSVAEATLPVVVRVDVEKRVAAQRSPFEFFFNGREIQPPGQNEERYQGGYGSGIIIEQRQDTVYVLTNNHVVEGDNTKIRVLTHDGKTFEAQIVGNDKNRDIAVLSFVSKESMPVARLGDSNSVRAGDVVFAVGSPYGIQNTITQGIVSAVNRVTSDLPGGSNAIGAFTDYMQTDAAINPGNSGGALVNIAGEVIGINTWIATRTGENVGLGFAIPVNNARKVALDFINKGKVEYGWLGVTPDRVFDENRSALKLSQEQQGAFIYNMIKDSPAERSGLLPGDLIVTVDTTTIRNADDLIRTIAGLETGKEVKIGVLRDGKPVTIAVTLGLRDESVDASSYWPGFAVMPATEAIRSQLRASDNTDQSQNKSTRNTDIPLNSVIVVRVEEGSSASEAGLRTGDVLVAVNGQNIKDAGDFYRVFTTNGSNTRLEVKIMRNNREITISWQR